MVTRLGVSTDQIVEGSLVLALSTGMALCSRLRTRKGSDME